MKDSIDLSSQSLSSFDIVSTRRLNLVKSTQRAISLTEIKSAASKNNE